ncbi:MAG: winged helix-turn-helix transcriptional regulator [Candidatus Rokubacteria bacterium]|nr:winged helix-turn-helix transcriptional regulator [Candidatus Rokubacteria bacterium]
MSDTSRSTDRAAELFHALADPTRLMILSELRDGEQCVCVLAERFETGQSRLSFHMKTLKDAGLVTDRRQGRWIYYALNPAALEDAGSVLASLRPGRAGVRVAPPARARV